MEDRGWREEEGYDQELGLFSKGCKRSWDGTEVEGLEEEWEDLNIAEKTIYHSRPFERIFRDLIGAMGILKEIFGFHPQEEDFESMFGYLS